jgi:hypothetical protein
VSTASSYDISATSTVKSLWLQEIQESFSTDPQATKWLSKPSMISPIGFYTLKDGLIRYKERIWVGSNTVLHTKFSIHSMQVPLGVTLDMKLHTRG